MSTPYGPNPVYSAYKPNPFYAQNIQVCALCGKPIAKRERTRFVLFFENRKKYSSWWIKTPTKLYFHEKCIRGININISELFDLLRVMGILEGKKDGKA